MFDLPYWLALTRVSVLGARRIHRLIRYCGSAKDAFALSQDQLFEAGLPPKVAAVFLHERKKIDPEAELSHCLKLGIGAVTIMDDRYPPLLKEIYDPPPVLYYLGCFDALSDCSVAVVGSRKATAYGKAAAEQISCRLAQAGIHIVSGMARGIDTCAHQGTIRAGGRTFAVLGCGLDICYPPENRKLRDRIIQEGAVLSEFPLGVQPKPAHFPMRNRIISGLSKAVVVVEAAEKSGALITADCALEQGRDVFAVPGSIHSQSSKGCHRLIKEGAAVAENADDILTAIGHAANVVAAAASSDMPHGQAAVLQAMEYEPVHFDKIAVLCGLPAAALSAVLVELELRGQIKKMPGNFYLRV